MKKSASDKEASTKRRYEITYADLPLSCPPREDRVWDSHPRIYMPIEEKGRVVCPYCGAEYILQNFVAHEGADLRVSEKKLPIIKDSE